MNKRFPSLDEFVNESKLIESNLKPVTKKTWDKADHDQRVDYVAQAIDDMDKAEEYAEMNYDQLPDEITTNMYESRIVEKEEDWDPNHEYGVFYVGGSINEKKNGIVRHFPKGAGKLIWTYATADEAKKSAKDSRSRLSPGEKKYYGISYMSAKLTPGERKEIANITGKPLNEGLSTDFVKPGITINVMGHEGVVNEITKQDADGIVWEFTFTKENGQQHTAMLLPGDKYILKN